METTEETKKIADELSTEQNEDSTKETEEIPKFESIDSKKNVIKYGIWDYGVAFLLIAAAWVYIWKVCFSPGVSLMWFTVLFAASGLCLIKQRKQKMTREGTWYLILLAVTAFWFLVEHLQGDYHMAHQPITPYMALFLHIIGVYWLLTISGARIRGRLDESGIIDLARGFFIIPFVYFGTLFSMAASAFREFRKQGKQGVTEKHRRIGQAAFGAVLSIPVLFIVLPLLAKADESFFLFTDQFAVWSYNIFSQLVFFDFGDVVLNCFVFFCACYLCGLFFGSFRDKRIVKTESSPVYASKPERYTLPLPMLLSFGTIICGVYALFFLVKFADTGARLVSGQGTFVYSAYARQGFFELLFIALINFCIFYYIKCLSAAEHKWLKWCLSLLSIETLGFIVLAFSKMSLYISVYGFTFKRVLTSWFMAVLFITFFRLLICVWKKGNAIGPSVQFAMVSFLLLAYSQMELWMNALNQMMNLPR